MAVSRTFEYTIDNIALASWLGFGADEDGGAIRMGAHSDLTVQVAGTANGATVSIQGSNDGVSYHPLTLTPSGNNASFTAAGIGQLAENPVYVKVVTVGGDTSTALDVMISAPARA